MFEQTVFSVRNILLIQLLIITLVPEHAFGAYQNIVNFWKKLSIPVYSSSLFMNKMNKKESKFWEIDMTKFEP